jgi:hypothetical protein
MNPAEINLLSKIVTETATKDDFIAVSSRFLILLDFFKNPSVGETLRKFQKSVHLPFGDIRISIDYGTSRMTSTGVCYAIRTDDFYKNNYVVDTPGGETFIISGIGDSKK